MGKATLHIVNGDSLGDWLQELHYEGDYIVWREMLCEGPTTTDLLNDRFIQKRTTFLQQAYKVPPEDYKTKFVSQLEKLENADSYEEIILWFEYDLFCHLNLMACLRFLKKLNRKEKITLVCSGRIPNEPALKGLSELTEDQLRTHYDARVQLDDNDLDLAHLIWSYYSKGQVRKLKPGMAKDTHFTYLSNCLRAHKERFPDSVTGLNTLETTVLSLIDKHRITSKHQLCGYALSHQGYYGFGDTQLRKIIDKLAMFYTEEEDKISLNKEGIQALQGDYNFYHQLKDDTQFGGNLKYGHVYDAARNKLIKTKL